MVSRDIIGLGEEFGILALGRQAQRISTPPDEVRPMSTSTISVRFGTRILRTHGALLLAGAAVLFMGASCNSAKVSNETGPTGGGTGHGGGGNGGGGNSGSGDCIVCTGTGGPGGGGGGGTTGGPSLKHCGDGKLDNGEGCDDGNTDRDDQGNTTPEDGCNHLCQLEAGWLCPTPGQPCVDQRVCGNGKLTSDEACDDGNTNDGDGCSADCKTVEDGYQCRQQGKPCVPLCGDGKKIGSETCDDGNNTSGDGCSSTCQKEPGADCPEVGKPCVVAECGNGKTETGELCDAGKDKNGLFYGDGKGCSKTCTKEPSCRDSSGKNRACDTACGDGNIDPGEACDDGNQVSGDGCSSDCKVEDGFTCEPKTHLDSSTCQAGTGTCLELPIIYRDFQPENVASGGHPDFYWLGTKANGSTSSTTICVPNAGGPSKGNDSTARSWDIAAPDLLNGKPQYNSARANNQCACQFSDWSIGNVAHIPSGYSQAGNDSPMSNGAGGYIGGAVGTPIDLTNPSGKVTGTLLRYTTGTLGGPVFNGVVPIVKDANSFKQWFTDDKTVNTTYTAVLEMPAFGTNLYRYASTSHLAQGGFYPLDTLNPSQATLCNLWPYWNHGNGTPIWATCTGDQYLFPPRIIAGDCGAGAAITNGCWITAVPGVKHDNYFTTEARYFFVYDKTNGISLQFFGDDDLFIFINGKLVLDLGGVHQQLPGKVDVSAASNNDAVVVEGGCLDAAGNITGVTVGSNACSPTNPPLPPTATTPDDFRNRTVPLGLVDGKVYEIAIFGADRHPPESNYQLTLSGFTTKTSWCQPRCGDGVVSGGEECDCGDDALADLPKGCTGKNNDTEYGGCKKDCTWGPFCGDGNTDQPQEQCDKGKDNGSDLSKTGCTFSCMTPHVCGDGFTDTNLGEQCDMGALNDVKVDVNGKQSDAAGSMVECDKDCQIPPWVP